MEIKFEEERTKREKEVKIHQITNKRQSKTISRIRSGRQENCRGSSSKVWTEYSRQQQYNKKKDLAIEVRDALTFCQDKCFCPCTL